MEDPARTIHTDDVEKAASTIFSNPDEDVIGIPPDGYRGLHTAAIQRLQKSINARNYGSVDVVIAQWSFEPVGPAEVYGYYGLGFDQSPTGINSRWRSTSTNADWNNQGFANSLRVGGVQVYIMKPGESPFPGLNGPRPPIDTISLQYGEDVLHDCTRALGSFYEVIDTTAKLNKQGSSFNYSVENPTNEKCSVIHYEETGPNPLLPLRQTGQIECDQEILPTADVDDMLKYKNSLTMLAEHGVFAPGRLNLEANAPTQGLSYNAIFVGGNRAGPLDFGSERISLLVSHHILDTVQVTAGDDKLNNINELAPYNGKCYKTNMSMQVSVFSGLAENFAATVIRRLTGQSFCTTGSKYLAFSTYNAPAPDPIAMSALQTAINNTPDFYPSKSNADGSAWKKMKGAFNKALKVAKPIASVGKGMMKQMAMQAINQAAGATPGGAAALAVTKKVFKAANKAKATKKKPFNNNNNNNKKTGSRKMLPPNLNNLQ